jgi:hypothetical protein
MPQIIATFLALLACILAAIFTRRYVQLSFTKFGKNIFSDNINSYIASHITSEKIIWLTRITAIIAGLNFLLAFCYNIIAYFKLGQQSEVLKSIGEFLYVFGHDYQDVIMWILFPLYAYLAFIQFKVDYASDPNYALFNVLNQSELPLTVFINDRKVGIIEPGKQKYYSELLVSHGKYAVVAKTEDENICYSREYNRQELLELSWNVTISSPDISGSKGVCDPSACK